MCFKLMLFISVVPGINFSFESCFQTIFRLSARISSECRISHIFPSLFGEKSPRSSRPLFPPLRIFMESMSKEAEVDTRFINCTFRVLFVYKHRGVKLNRIPTKYPWMIPTFSFVPHVSDFIINHSIHSKFLAIKSGDNCHDGLISGQQGRHILYHSNI